MVLLNVVHDIDEIVNIECHSLESVELCKKFLLDYNLKILCLNIRSLQCNFDDFALTLNRLDCDIDAIILTECWLSKGQVLDILPGYVTFRTTQQTNKNGGVVMYIKNSLRSVQQDTKVADADTVSVVINNQIAVLGIYRSPSILNLDTFIHSVDNTLSSLKIYPTIIVAGDLNIDICNNSNNSVDYQCLMATHGLLPAISKPTRGRACIDHIFIKSTTKSTGVVCKSSITDHDIIIAGLSTSKKGLHSQNLKLKSDFDAIALELDVMDWSDIMSQSCINSAVSIFNHILTTTIDKHTRKIKIGRKWVTMKPWITPGLLRCMRHRDKLHLELRTHPNDLVRRKVYSRYRNFCNKILKKLKNEYNRKQIVENKNDSKQLWKTIKNICQTVVKNNDSSELLNIGTNAETSLCIANRYFVSVGKNLADSILHKLGTTQESLIAAYRPITSFNHSFFLHPTDPYEVRNIILQLKTDSSPGPDRFTASLFKKSIDSFLAPLSHIINISLNTGIFPDCWKMAAVTPIFKNGSKNLPDNYRPIALLSVTSKILERIVNNRLVSFLQKHNLISDRQFGFRRGRSTEDATSLLVNQVSNYVENDECCIAVFLDLAKAFDTVSVGLLLKKMESHGIRGVAHDWFRSYLSNRKQFVKVGSHLSEPLPINFGVPQGSILGPTLFTMYINDVVSCALDNASIIAYADDTVLLFHERNWDQVYHNAAVGLAHVADLLDKNLLTLNIKKTNYVAFSKTSAGSPHTDFSLTIHSCSQKRPTNGFQPPPTCTCTQMSRVMKTKYLGIIIDENLSYKDHINDLSSRVRKLIFIMKKLRDCTPPDTLRLVYLGLCQSIMQYCISVWGSAGKTTFMSLERAQRALIKVMLRKPFRFPTNTLYDDFKVLRMRQLFVLNATIKAHRSFLNRPDYTSLLTRRVFRLPVPRATSLLSRRSPNFAHTNTYNKVCKQIEIKVCNVLDCKKKVKEWLQTLSYELTENLI